MSKSIPLTAVMYHYVRPIAESAYPGIKGLELAAFRRQLDYIEKNFNVVSVAQVVKAVREGAPLPERPALLSFDDGYYDHYAYVFPELVKRRYTGVFFPVARALENREILDVNKIHYFLASIDDLTPSIRYIESEIELARSQFPSLKTLGEYRATYFVPNRFDTAEVIYIKRLLQHALPLELRARITDELFRRYVSKDPSTFADQIYLNTDQLKEMVAGGMEFGSHGSAHLWMNQTPVEAQAKDLDDSLECLVRMGLSRENFYYCYPYGGYNADTLRLLSERKCAAAFTTRPEIFEVNSQASLLEISRFDTNDLPR